MNTYEKQKKTNVFEKGIATLSIEYQFLNAIKKYFKNQKFDIILYSTPPITFSGIISYIKQRDNAFSYLLLKDFGQPFWLSRLLLVFPSPSLKGSSVISHPDYLLDEDLVEVRCITSHHVCGCDGINVVGDYCPNIFQELENFL